MKIIINGTIHDSEDVELVNLLLKLRKKKGQWETINAIVELWATKFPHEVQEMANALKDYRETLNDSTFGQTNQGKDFERRLITSFPQRLYLLIKVVYGNKIKFDQKFYQDFARKFRFFRIPDKI